MKVDEFLKTLTEIMDTETNLTLDTKLSDVEEWDSLSLVSYLSFCSARSKNPVLPEDLRAAQTVQDLYKFVEAE